MNNLNHFKMIWCFEKAVCSVEEGELVNILNLIYYVIQYLAVDFIKRWLNDKYS